MLPPNELVLWTMRRDDRADHLLDGIGLTPFGPAGKTDHSAAA
jgi:hypothetical protein